MNKNLTYDDLFPSRFLKASDFEDDTVVTIVDIDFENVHGNGGGEERKSVLYFREFDKPLILNRTNGDILKELFGSPQNWVDQKITLYTTPVTIPGGKTAMGIRIKNKPPKAAAQPVPPEPEAFWPEA